MVGFAAALLACGCAHGQFGGSISAQSDYRFRGVSLSGGKPDLQMSLAYDHASGWYAGGSLTRVVFGAGRRRAALLGYVGYARGLAPGLSWEAGAIRSGGIEGAAAYDRGEVYAGLIGKRWSTRLYLADNDFGRDVRSAYAELEAGWPLSPALRLFGHAGALTPLDGGRPRYDVRLGLGLRIDACDLQLAWVGSTRGGPYPSTYEPRRDTVVLGVSFSF